MYITGRKADCFLSVSFGIGFLQPVITPHVLFRHYMRHDYALFFIIAPFVSCIEMESANLILDLMVGFLLGSVLMSYVYKLKHT